MTRAEFLRLVEQTLLSTEARMALRALALGVQDNIDAGGAAQALIQFEDEGVNLGTSGTVNNIDFTGIGVTASRVGNTVTVDIPGGGGGSNARGINTALRSEGAATLVVGTNATIIIPYDMTISVAASWVIASNTTASVVVGVLRATVATPNTFASIAAAAKPTLTAAVRATGAMTGWSTSLLAGERVRLSVESASGTTAVQVLIPAEAT